jgi:hypothetical protein
MISAPAALRALMTRLISLTGCLRLIGLFGFGLYFFRLVRNPHTAVVSAGSAPAAPQRSGGTGRPPLLQRERRRVEAAPATVAPASPEASTRSRGHLPILSLVGSLGLLLVSLAFTGARAEAEWAGLLFWAGLLTLYVPIAGRLFSSGASRGERIGLVALLGLGLYLVKVMHSPLAFTFSDELQHWRTVQDIARGGRLFEENPLLPVSPFYSGLESLTHALTSLSGLSIFGGGVVLVGLARLVLVVALYLFYEEVSRSSRVAGIAALLYMANPNFVFFGAHFAYESVALPLAALTLFAAARRERAPREDQLGLTLAVLLGLGAAVTTHHLTGYALAGFISLWAVTALLGRCGSQDHHPSPAGPALLALIGSMAWLVYIASLIVGYLAPNLVGGVTEVVRLITGELTGRELFRSFTGQVAPPWEQFTGYASVVLILIGMPFGLLEVWRRFRASPLALALAIGSLAYPASLALRYTTRGAEMSNRASEFLFVAVAFVLALAAVGAWPASRPARRWSAAITAWAAVIFVGGLIVGWAPWARLPGPYLVAADSRSIEPQGVAAAAWAHSFLGPDNRIATDRVNRLIMGSYGGQRPVTNAFDGVYTPGLFFSPDIGPAETDIVRRGRIQYVVVDRRLSSGLPMVGVYFEQGEPDTYRHTTPMDSAALAKFDGLQRASRVFDSGDLAIYDVGTLSHVR